MHYSLIGDNSYFFNPHSNCELNEQLENEKMLIYQTETKSKFIYKLKRMKFSIKKLVIKIFYPLKKKYLKIYTFLPDSNFSLFWDIINICFLQFVLFYFPYHLGVEFFTRNHVNAYYDFLRLYLPFAIFLIDVFIHFHTAFYSMGILIKSKSLIAKEYITTYFLPDIFSLIILWIMIFKNETSHFSPCILLKIFKMRYLTKKLFEHIYLSYRWQNVVNIVNLIYTALYITHLCACMWHFSSMVSFKLIYIH